MPRIKGQDKSYWDSMSKKVGDALEDNLMQPDEFFVEKYGDEWESKRDSARENVRSLYGLIPQSSKTATKDAIITALAFMIGRPIAGRQKVWRGITGGEIRDLEKNVRGQKRIMGSKDYDRALHSTESPLIGSGYMEGKPIGAIAERHVAGISPAPDRFFNRPVGGTGSLLEFDVPYSYMMEEALGGPVWRQFGRIGGRQGGLIPGAREIEFREGILTDFLTDVHKAGTFRRGSLPERGWEDLTDFMSRF
jgi:hypothetical protein